MFKNQKKDSLLFIDQFNKLFLIAINSPSTKNALSPKIIQLLRSALTQFSRCDKTDVGVLFGMGGNFSSGFNVFDHDRQFTLKHLLDVESFQYPRLIGTKSKPLIVALNGWTVGAGLELALLADLRIADRSSQLGFLNRRFGIPSLDGIGPYVLPQMIGLSRAQNLLLTGKAFTAKQAYDWGLIDHLTEDGSVIGKAMNIAQSLVKFPQSSLLKDREMLFGAMNCKDFSAFTISYTSATDDYTLAFEKAQKHLKDGKGPSFNIDNL